MGKQSKRKNKQRRGGGGSGGHHRPTGLADDPSSLLASSASTSAAASASSSTTDPAAKIILKIRHGDPRVRHASLVALSRTLYDATSLENAASKKMSTQRSDTGGNKKKNATAGASSSSLPTSGAVEACNPTLLRALSERILDVDIPCATIAVGCLSNYISFYYGISGDDGGDGKKKKRGSGGGGGVASLDDGYDDEDVVASDVMVPILLQRIQSTSVTLQSMIPVLNTDDDAKKKKKDNSDNIVDGATDKLKLKIQEQWTLLSLTLDALAGLIENCPRAVQHLSCGWKNNNNNHSSSNITGHLFDVLKLTCTPSLEPIMDTAINALRALHSLLDDNFSLIDSIISTSPTMEPGPTPSSLHSIASQLEILTTNGALPIMARLHACGSLLALRSVYLQQRMAWEGGKPPLSSSTEPQQLDTAIERVQNSTEDFVLPCLYSFFGKYAIQTDVESISSQPTTTMHFLLIQKMMTLSKRLSDMKNDENVEMQVVSQVNARAEPARLIARRQKEMKAKMNDGSTMDEVVEVEEAPSTNAADQTDKNEDMDAVMVVDDNEESSTNEHQQQQKQKAEDDLRDELDNVVSEWKATVGSQKLALELVANLTSGKEMEIEDDEDEDDEDEGMMYAADDDDDEHMWDSDDEARLLSSSANSKHAGDAVTTTNMNIAAYDNAIYNSMMDARHNLPMTLLHYFRYWVEFLPNAATFAATNPTAGTDTADADIKEEAKPAARLPKLVSQDVEEILSTCAICLGNVVACNLLEGVGENDGKNNTDLFLRQLVSMLYGSTSSLACSNERGGNNQVMRSECRHQQHVTSVMLSLLRNQPPSRMLIDTQTLDHLIALLPQRQRTGDTMDDDDVEAMLQAHRNITSMLGVLCTNSEVPHPETTDRKVCRALLSRLACAISNCDGGGGNNWTRAMVDSIVIAHEILNVLMDMYGNDDCHERVFDEECVLDQLRKCLPWFKRSVKKVVAAASSASSDPTRWEESKMEEVNEDGCVWNETALNATRFIKYKQDMVRR